MNLETNRYNYAITPRLFIGISEFCKRSESKVSALNKIQEEIFSLEQSLDAELAFVNRVCKEMDNETRRNTRKSKQGPTIEYEAGEEDKEVSRDITTVIFLRSVLQQLHLVVSEIHSMVMDVTPIEFARVPQESNAPYVFGKPSQDSGQIINIFQELQVNKPLIDRFVGGVINIIDSPRTLCTIVASLSDSMATLYDFMHHRHTVEGIKIHVHPIATDVALTIFSNVDSHGEIREEGRSADEVSAYTVRKAGILVQAVCSGILRECVRNDSSYIISFISNSLRSLWSLIKLLNSYVAPVSNLIVQETRKRKSSTAESDDMTFESLIDSFSIHDLGDIHHRDTLDDLSRSERMQRNFENDTLENIVKMLRAEVDPSDVISYIIKRKIEWRTRSIDENSFFVCKISAGNSFGGLAPGAIAITPAERPKVDLTSVRGSGFDEVRAYLDQLDAEEGLHDLFVATAPASSGAKDNVLLLGPPGCGKTEAMRAVGGKLNSIGISASGSDFLTAWKGEAEKNPKRLFKKAKELVRTYNRRVHILIDEIDEILRERTGPSEGFGGTNLVTEFLQLMDGIEQFPMVSLWGATNHPELLSARIKRRFQKVIIVGELSAEDREILIKQFFDHLPNNVTEQQWKHLASLLDGSVGDVFRKVADSVWRVRMAEVSAHKRSEALRLQEWLNSEGSEMDGGKNGTACKLALRSKLSSLFVITSNDIELSIRSRLDNLSVQEEILAARETYRRAHEYADAQRASRSGIIIT
jgi:hypothetical protein